MLLALLVAVCASSFHAVRVYRVSCGSSVCLRTLIPVCLTLVLAFAAMFSSRSVAGFQKGAALLAVGSFVILIATVVETVSGLAVVAVLTPEEPLELGFAKVTLRNFTASYGEMGNLLESRSNLILELEGRRESLNVVSGSPETVRGVSVSQIGFGRAEGSVDVRPYSKLGFLKERAGWAFMTGLALFDIGALFFLFSVRVKERERQSISPALPSLHGKF